MTVEQAEVDPAKVDELMGRLIRDFGGAGSIPLTMIGIRTGLWRAMAGAGPLTPAEVAERSGTAERSVAEWLKAQAAGGYVAYHPESGRFSLPAEAAAVLADDGGSRLVAGFSAMLLAMARDYALVEEGFRSGRGVGWHERSPEHWDGADDATSAFIGADLPAWLAALDGLEDRLRAGARVAGRRLRLRRAHDRDGLDLPGLAVLGLRLPRRLDRPGPQAAAAAGVADRVQFEVATAKEFGGRYDLVVYVDSLHDLGDPVGAVAHLPDSRACVTWPSCWPPRPAGARRPAPHRPPAGRGRRRPGPGRPGQGRLRGPAGRAGGRARRGRRPRRPPPGRAGPPGARRPGRRAGQGGRAWRPPPPPRRRHRAGSQGPSPPASATPSPGSAVSTPPSAAT